MSIDELIEELENFKKNGISGENPGRCGLLRHPRQIPRSRQRRSDIPQLR